MYENFFSSSADATKFVNLVSFRPFADTADAVSAATACVEGKVSKGLKSFLKKELGSSKKSKKATDSLAVADKALA
eukprot:11903958-Ditylum_brightwellii.AAC.1